MLEKRLADFLRIGREHIKVFTPGQPNRVLADKPPAIRVVIAQEIVVKASLLVVILVLKSERLVRIRVNLVSAVNFPQASYSPATGYS